MNSIDYKIKSLSYEHLISMRRYIRCNYDKVRKLLKNSITGSITIEHKDGWSLHINDTDELNELLRQLI